MRSKKLTLQVLSFRQSESVLVFINRIVKALWKDFKLHSQGVILFYYMTRTALRAFFFCKTIDESPVRMRAVRICASGAGKSRTALLEKRPRVVKFQENLSPNWSYDKILID